jgi:3-dehydroquinate synthetase
VVVLLERLGLPTRVPEPVTAERLLAAMAGDKKNRRRGIRFALPRGLGAMGPGPDWTTEAGEPAIRAALLAIS